MNILIVKTLPDIGKNIIVENKLHNENNSAILAGIDSISICYIAYFDFIVVGCSVVIDNKLHTFVKDMFRRGGIGTRLVKSIKNYQEYKKCRGSYARRQFWDSVHM
jgi:hypothetical protein